MITVLCWIFAIFFFNSIEIEANAPTRSCVYLPSQKSCTRYGYCYWFHYNPNAYNGVIDDYQANSAFSMRKRRRGPRRHPPSPPPFSREPTTAQPSETPTTSSPTLFPSSSPTTPTTLNPTAFPTKPTLYPTLEPTVLTPNPTSQSPSTSPSTSPYPMPTAFPGLPKAFCLPKCQYLGKLNCLPEYFCYWDGSSCVKITPTKSPTIQSCQIVVRSPRRCRNH